MADRASDLIPVLQRSYDLCAGLYEPVNRFPRAQRTLLGRVSLEDALQMLVLRTVANRRTEKRSISRRCSGSRCAITARAKYRGSGRSVWPIRKLSQFLGSPSISQSRVSPRATLGLSSPTRRARCLTTVRASPWA
jgi:hypothetical protein